MDENKQTNTNLVSQHTWSMRKLWLFASAIILVVLGVADIFGPYGVYQETQGFIVLHPVHLFAWFGVVMLFLAVGLFIAAFKEK